MDRSVIIAMLMGGVCICLLVVGTGGYFAYAASAPKSTVDVGAGAGTGAQSPPGPTYVFTQGMDSGGGDIGQEAALADNVLGLKNWCTAHTECLGFNTNGWMKSSLLPEAQWSKWTDEPNKGFYKKS